MLAGEAPSGATTPVARLPLPTRRERSAACGERRRRRHAQRVRSAARHRHARAHRRRRRARRGGSRGARAWRRCPSAPAASTGRTRRPRRRPGSASTASCSTRRRSPGRSPRRWRSRAKARSARQGARQARLLGQGPHDAAPSVELSLAACRWRRSSPTCTASSAAALGRSQRRRSRSPGSRGEGAPKLQMRREAAAPGPARASATPRRPRSPPTRSSWSTRASTPTRARRRSAELALRAPARASSAIASSRWGFERWLRAAPAATVAGDAAPLASHRRRRVGAAPRLDGRAPVASPPRSLEPGRRCRLEARGRRVRRRPRAGRLRRPGLAVPAALDVRDIAVQLRGWTLEGAAAAPFRVAARVAVPAGAERHRRAGSGVVGSVDANGELKGFTGGVAEGAPRRRCCCSDLPMHLLDPYLDDAAQHRRAEGADRASRATSRWERRAAGTVLSPARRRDRRRVPRQQRAETDAAPRRARLALVRGAARGAELLSWKSLSLRGIDVAIAPGAPTRIAVAETTLERLLRPPRPRRDRPPQPAGHRPPDAGARHRLRRQRTGRCRVGAAASVADQPGARRRGAPAGIRRRRRSSVRPDHPRRRPRQLHRPLRAAQLQRQPERAERPPRRVLVAAAGAGPPPLLADVSLRGRVQGTASLEITGKANPLARPLALDLQAKVRDLELPPLSPYAIKYSGYGIERGKMSVDLAYVVQPDGQLTASNKIVLNQLAFGDKVRGLDGEPAGQARRRAAHRSQRRDRSRPAGERLHQRPAVLDRRRDLEGRSTTSSSRR